VRTLRSAAALLAAAAGIHQLYPILHGLGFDDPPHEADVTTRASLGIPATYRDVTIVRGRGSLRALLLVAPAHLSIREATTRIAARLATAAPHILWLLVVSDPVFREIAIATWSIERRPPRVAALVVNREHVVDSDAETLCALGAARGEVDVLTHARWLEILGREAVTRRFYRTLERIVGALGASLPGRIATGDRAELALLCVSRLLFLSFLEAKGWLDGDRGFLARTFDACVSSGGHYHRRILLPLLHGTLNTPCRARSPTARAFGRVPFLNGGLFARTPVEQRHRALVFPDDALGALFGELLARYRFTAREDSTAWSEAAVDPEMMGKAFESIMVSRERRTSGAYYTPQALVERVTSAALTQTLAHWGIPPESVASLLRGESPASETAPTIRARLAQLRIVDPACGSGAFLVHALERLAQLHAMLGDQRSVVEIRRDVLVRSIFGVDRNPFAVWLCELRLWLSMVIESESDDPRTIPPLPNLDHHIRVGDALAGEGLAPLGMPGRAFSFGRREGSTIAALRSRYVRATGPRKRSLARALDRAERDRAIALLDTAIAANAAHRRDLLSAVRAPDLFGARHPASASARRALEEFRIRGRALRVDRRAIAAGILPFSFATHFADAASAGGFDVVVGNPPWVRLHRIPPATRAELRGRFAVFRERGWDRGAAAAHASPGFAAQVDLAALFVERSLELLRDGGVLAMLVPAKLWRSLAGGTLRRMLIECATPLEIDDLTDSIHSFDAAVYPSMIAARRGRRIVDGLPSAPSANGRSGEQSRITAAPIAATLDHRGSMLRWTVDHVRLGFDSDAASPWLVVPPEVRDAFDLVSTAGVPLAESALGRPHLGVKCGCNAAFLVSECGTMTGALTTTGVLVADIEGAGRRGCIERTLLRPLVRGETLNAWRVDLASAERILWPYDTTNAPLAQLPTHARHWFLPWRRQLMARSDGRGRGCWWTLFRTEAARSDCARVVWADFGRVPRAAVLESGDPTVPLNSCYVVRCPTLSDARALCTLLNSPLVAAWLGILAEPARGGYRRYLGWTMALLPVPRDWANTRNILAPVAERGARGHDVSPHELLAVTLRAYGLGSASVEPLLTWSAG
jgi:hypothetical protein